MDRSEDRHDAIECEICKDKMRCDNYGRHMKTHLNALLMATNRTKAVENKHPVVSYVQKGVRRCRTRFAYCFVCADYEHAGSEKESKWRHEHERWCMDCEKPHPGKVSGETVLDADTMCMCAHMPLPQNTKGNKVDAFIAKHNVECRSGFTAVQQHFVMGKVPPKPRGIRSGTAAKAPRKTLETHGKRVQHVVDDRLPRDRIAARFPQHFEYYFYDQEQTEEDCVEDERDEQRGMTLEEMLDLIATKLNEAETNVEEVKQAVVKNVTKQYENKLRAKNKEYDELEQETIRLRGEVEAMKHKY